MALLGSHERLGGWDPKRAIFLERRPGDVWLGHADLPSDARIQYKYVVMPESKDEEKTSDGTKNDRVIQWQPGQDLVLTLSQEMQDEWPTNEGNDPGIVLETNKSYDEDDMEPFLQVVDVWEPNARRSMPAWTKRAEKGNDSKSSGAAQGVQSKGKPDAAGKHEDKNEKETEVRRTLLVDCGTWQTRCAVLEEGQLVQLLTDREDQESVAVGDVLLGVIKSYIPVMKAYLVDIGVERFALMDVGLHKAKKIMSKLMAGESVEYVEDDSLTTDDSEYDEEEQGEQECNDDVYMMSFSEDILSGSDGTSLGASSDGLSDDGAVLLSDDATTSSTSQDIGDLFSPGEQVIVQVTRMPSGRKGHKVTGTISLSGKLTVLTPETVRVGVSRKIKGLERTRLACIAAECQPANCGVIVRTEAEGRLEVELSEDIKSLHTSWTMVLQKAKTRIERKPRGGHPKRLLKGASLIETVVKDMFGRKVDELVVNSKSEYLALKSGLSAAGYKELAEKVIFFQKQDALLFDEYHIGNETEAPLFGSECLPLEGGGNIILQVTDALTSIDVNGGRAVFNQDMESEAAVLEVNLAAARRICRELRLRDIGGIVVIDFIDMKKKPSKKLVEEEVERCAALDGADFNIGKISEFGLLELTRARRMPHLSAFHNLMCKCPSCEGSRYVQTPLAGLQAIEREVKRWKVLVVDELRELGYTNTNRPVLKLIVGGMLGKFLRANRKQLNRLESREKVYFKISIDPFLTEGLFRLEHKKSSARSLASPSRAPSKKK